MKKSIPLVLSLFLLSTLLPDLSSQSPVKDLDQVELMKQFIGTWEAEIGEDTMVVLELTPLGGALNFVREVKVSGTTVNISAGIYGFSQDKKSVIAATVFEDGSMWLDHGRFVSANKYVAETYTDRLEHPLALEVIEFQSPDAFTGRSRWRGEEMSWDAPWSPLWTFHKVN